jgi:serine/threonine-protein kinase
VVLILVAAGVLGWYFADGRYTHTPKLLGKSQPAAEAALQKAGLHVRIGAAVHSIPYAKGTIAREVPGPGARITGGGTVTLHPSLGPEYHQLPALNGDNATTATAALNALHISVSAQSHVYATDVPKGFYVKTVPGAGASVPEGSSVVLAISKGPKPVTVPDVSNLSVADATTALQAEGLLVDPDGRQKYSNKVPAGDVIATSPASGTSKHEGSTIHLVVSKGPRLMPVPNVVGENIDQAIQDIKNAGFAAAPHEVFSGGPGDVIRETPADSEPKGTSIELDYY